MKLIGDKIIVRIDEREEKSTGGIYFANKDNAAQFLYGTVIDVGPGAVHPASGRLIPLDVVVGNRVMLNKQSGINSIKLENGDYIVAESDLVGIYE